MTSRLTSESHGEDAYRQLLDTAPDAILVVNPGSRIEVVNVQAESLFGYARAELVGQPLEILIPKRFRGAHAIHTRHFFGAPRARAKEAGLELYGAHKDGRDIPIEVCLSPVPRPSGTWVSAAIRDISERKAIQAALALHTARLSSAVESTEDAFALFDAEDLLVLCNRVYAEIVGDGPPSALVGRRHGNILEALMRIVVFATEEEAKAFHRASLTERSDEKATIDLRTVDGRRLRVSNRRTGEGGIVQTIWDLTEDMRRAEELQEARKAAEAGSAAKTEFLSSMSHELRTPLNAILGFAQLLRRDKKEPLLPRHSARVDQILKGGEHLLRLIEDILDLSRIEAGRVALANESIDAMEVLEEVLETLQSTAALAGISAALGPPPAMLPDLRGDRARLRQILMNFGSNAIKYNRRAGTLCFSVSVVAPDRVRITCVDSGIGVPHDKQDTIFQPFQRAGQEAGPIEGTGIGLAISKRLVDLMGGTVGFRSTPGEGSEFWVELPAATESGRARPRRSP